MRLEIWLKQIVDNQEIRALFISTSEDISYIKRKSIIRKAQCYYFKTN